MARLPQRWQPIAMMLVIVPFWTSFSDPDLCLDHILQHDGLLNKILLALHIVSAPVVWLSTDKSNVSRHRLFLPAVHDPAALCDAGQNGRFAA